MPGCLVCGGRRFRQVFSEAQIAILRCRDCSHVFSSYAGDPHYVGFWGDRVEPGAHLYWSKARARMHQDFVDRFLRGRSGRLLDMGCGLGFFVQVAARQSGWEATGCEISAAAVRYARDTLNQRVVCARLEAAPLPSASFDVITMWDVIDHILSPDPVLERCHALLKKDGVLFLRTPNISIHLPRARLKRLLWGERPDVAYLQPRDHMHHYSPSTIRRLLERNGFSQISFLHLRPIDSASASGGIAGRIGRRLWFHGVRCLDTATRGHLNLDNLFVAAQK